MTETHDPFAYTRPDLSPQIVRGRLIGTSSALGGRPDAELVALEDELNATMARYDKRPLADDEAYSIASQCRELEQRINETAPETGIGAAVKLRQVLRVIEGGSTLEDDEIVSLRQLLAIAEALT
jgi:hypothetical protein